MHNVNVIFILCIISLCSHALGYYDDKWHGVWFPTAPGTYDNNPSVSHYELEHLAGGEPDLRDDKHGVKMGVASANCDDGKTNLTVDWDGSAMEYACFESTSYPRKYNVPPIQYCEHIPKDYWALHACMNQSIEYDTILPTFGTHRPLWPKYGEYIFCPKQRWLHSMEHGAIVMLYHPCADPRQINKLKRLVKRCLYRHIITPYNGLSAERPLAILSWGCRLLMNVVDREIATKFIQEHALKGPETVSKNGQYDVGLIDSANYVTDQNDNVLCPETGRHRRNFRMPLYRYI